MNRIPYFILRVHLGKRTAIAFRDLVLHAPWVEVVSYHLEQSEVGAGDARGRSREANFHHLWANAHGLEYLNREIQGKVGLGYRRGGAYMLNRYSRIPGTQPQEYE